MALISSTRATLGLIDRRILTASFCDMAVVGACQCRQAICVAVECLRRMGCAPSRRPAGGEEMRATNQMMEREANVDPGKHRRDWQTGVARRRERRERCATCDLRLKREPAKWCICICICICMRTEMRVNTLCNPAGALSMATSRTQRHHQAMRLSAPWRMALTSSARGTLAYWQCTAATGLAAPRKG
jgi:hypothetical protein